MDSFVQRFADIGSLAQCHPGGKIVQHAFLLDDEVSSLAESFDEPASMSEQSLPQHRSPSPEYSFIPLSPPPSHRRARRPDALIGPDDPRNLDVPLCRYVALVIITTSSNKPMRTPTPIQFPASTSASLVHGVLLETKTNRYDSRFRWVSPRLIDLVVDASRPHVM